MSYKIENLPTNEYYVPNFEEVQTIKQLFKPEPEPDPEPENTPLNLVRITSYFYISYILIFMSTLKLNAYFNNSIIFHFSGILFFIVSYLLLYYFT